MQNLAQIFSILIEVIEALLEDKKKRLALDATKTILFNAVAKVSKISIDLASTLQLDSAVVKDLLPFDLARQICEFNLSCSLPPD